MTSISWANFTEKYLWEKMSKYGKKCQNLSKKVKLCQKMSKFVKKSQIMSKNVKICQKCQNIIQKILKSLKKKKCYKFFFNKLITSFNKKIIIKLINLYLFSFQ